MVTATITETRRTLGKLIARAAKGEEVVITRGSTPVAKIQPLDDWDKPLELTDEEADALHRIARDETGVTFRSAEAAVKYLKKRFPTKKR